MDNSQETAAMYRKLNTSSLIELSKDPRGLRREIIPVLQAELIARGMKMQAQSLEKFLKDAETNVPIKDLSKEKLKGVIDERLRGGESIDNLKIYLRENEVDTYKVLGHDDEALRHILPLGKSVGDLLSDISSAHEGPSNSKIEIIKSDLETDYSDAADFRINTKKEITVYGDNELSRILRTEPKNTLLRYKRELIRYGQDLYLISEANGTKSYIISDNEETLPCQQCQVGENPIDFILISHEEFDKNIISQKIDRRIIKSETAQTTSSDLLVAGNVVYASLINKSSKKGSDVFTLNVVTFSEQVIDKIRIARLEPDYKFYKLESVGENDLAKKIKLADGREGVLLAELNSYKVIRNPLEKFALFLGSLSAIAICLGLMLAILESTGFLVIIGIVGVAIGYLCGYLIALPTYLLLNSILKRL